MTLLNYNFNQSIKQLFLAQFMQLLPLITVAIIASFFSLYSSATVTALCHRTRVLPLSLGHTRAYSFIS